ncbi:unnamed protein product [Trichogramma brassicae]|uniref:Major facilitator superfamily (MFS) profile domain-containing protein n=1 Tax=Trichogramma brassicae TaxID=86971 RepID=A0A6H5IVI2_9HYME|nr:unnamed protein product [Trichogramma brassicae]
MAPSLRAEDIAIGRYTFFCFTILAINFIAVGMSHSFGIFARYTPPVECTRTNLPPNHWPVDACSKNCTTRAFTPNSSQLVTVATSYELICDNKGMTNWMSWIYLAGLMFGAMIGGPLVDKIGRTFATSIFLVLTMVCGVVYMTSFMYLFLRFVQGLSVQGIEIGTYVLGLELMPKRLRTRASTSLLCARALGFCLMSLIDWKIAHWKGDVLVATVITAIGGVAFMRFMYESPRYLYTIDDVTKADQICNIHKLKNDRRSTAAVEVAADGDEGEEAADEDVSAEQREQQRRGRPQRLERVPRVLTAENLGKREEEIKTRLEPSKLSTVSEVTTRDTTSERPPMSQVGEIGEPSGVATPGDVSRQASKGSRNSGDGSGFATPGDVSRQGSKGSTGSGVATPGDVSRQSSKGSTASSTYWTAASRTSRFSRDSSHTESDDAASITRGARPGSMLRKMFERRGLSTDSDSSFERLGKQRNISNAPSTEQVGGAQQQQQAGQMPTSLSDQSLETCDSMVHQSGGGGRGPLPADLERLLPPDAVPIEQRQASTAEFAEYGALSRNVDVENPTAEMERNAEGELVPKGMANFNIDHYPGIALNLARLVRPGDAFTRQARNNLLWLWFTSAMVYHSLVVTPAGRLTESRHWNVALAGAFEIAVCFFVHCAVKRKRRVQPLVLAVALAGGAVFLLGGLAATPKDIYALADDPRGTIEPQRSLLRGSHARDRRHDLDGFAEGRRHPLQHEQGLRTERRNGERCRERRDSIQRRQSTGRGTGWSGSSSSSTNQRGRQSQYLRLSDSIILLWMLLNRFVSCLQQSGASSGVMLPKKYLLVIDKLGENEQNRFNQSPFYSSTPKRSSTSLPFKNHPRPCRSESFTETKKRKLFTSVMERREIHKRFLNTMKNFFLFKVLKNQDDQPERSSRPRHTSVSLHQRQRVPASSSVVSGISLGLGASTLLLLLLRGLMLTAKAGRRGPRTRRLALLFVYSEPVATYENRQSTE